MKLSVHFRSDPVTAYTRPPNELEMDVLEQFHEHACTCLRCTWSLDDYSADHLCPSGQRISNDLTSLLEWKLGRYMALANHNVVVEVPQRFMMARVLLYSVGRSRVYRQPSYTSRQSPALARPGLSTYQYDSTYGRSSSSEHLRPHRPARDPKYRHRSYVKSPRTNSYQTQQYVYVSKKHCKHENGRTRIDSGYMEIRQLIHRLYTAL